jgi:hypothetical protein
MGKRPTSASSADSSRMRLRMPPYLPRTLLRAGFRFGQSDSPSFRCYRMPHGDCHGWFARLACALHFGPSIGPACATTIHHPREARKQFGKLSLDRSCRGSPAQTTPFSGSNLAKFSLARQTTVFARFRDGTNFTGGLPRDGTSDQNLYRGTNSAVGCIFTHPKRLNSAERSFRRFEHDSRSRYG